jgi:hypothetical protein
MKRIFIKLEGPIRPRWLSSDPFWTQIRSTTWKPEGGEFVHGDSYFPQTFAVVRHRRSGELYGITPYVDNSGYYKGYILGTIFLVKEIDPISLVLDTAPDQEYFILQ